MKLKQHPFLQKLLCLICLLSCAALLFSGCQETGDLLGAAINDAGELVLTYSDGRQENLGVVVGKDGEKGEQGEKGEKGDKGENGQDGVNGQDGAPGLNGADGQDGKDGVDGKDGKDGVDGQNGADGKDGKDGIDGQDGALIIQGDSTDITAAATKGLRSAVSVICSITGSSYASAGAGVIYQLDKADGNAYIITNYHVVYDKRNSSSLKVSNTILVSLYGSELEGMEKMPATYVGGSMEYDIAVLRIENSEILKNSDCEAVTLADSDLIHPGETAIAIGNPKGSGTAVTSGIISVPSEHIESVASDGRTEVEMRLIRIDTPVNSGNSGGGLFNAQGELIGIVNAKNIESDVENIGYAIPTKVATGVADNLIDQYNGDPVTVKKAMLGITLQTTDSKAVFDPSTGQTSIEETVKIYSVTATGIAYGLLEVDDVILEATLNGKTLTITRQFQLIDLMLCARVGDTLELTVLRSGIEVSVSIPITETCLATVA